MRYGLILLTPYCGYSQRSVGASYFGEATVGGRFILVGRRCKRLGYCPFLEFPASQSRLWKLLLLEKDIAISASALYLAINQDDGLCGPSDINIYTICCERFCLRISVCLFLNVVSNHLPIKILRNSDTVVLAYVCTAGFAIRTHVSDLAVLLVAQAAQLLFSDALNLPKVVRRESSTRNGRKHEGDLERSHCRECLHN